MSMTKRTGAVVERVDAAAVIKLDILTLIIIRGRRSQRLKMLLLLLVLVWDETGGRCRIAALMDVAQVMLRLEVLIRIRVVWMGLLMVLMVLMLLMLRLLLLMLIRGDGATVDAAHLLPRRVGMRGGGGKVSHFRPPGNPRSFAREREMAREEIDVRSEI